MEVINPLTGAGATTDPQTGTWLADKLHQALGSTERAQSSQLAEHQPGVPMSKVPRSDSIPTTAGEESRGTSAVLDEVSQTQNIDPYSVKIGVGWTTVIYDAESLAAARGWSRYIERNYPLSNVTFLANSKRHDAYLVSTSEGWYLFKEDLSKGRLVAKESWEVTVKYLKEGVIHFEGSQELSASGSPGVVDKKEPDESYEEVVGHMDID